MNKTKLFQVGDFCFSLSYPPEILPPDHFMLFETAKGEPEYFYTLSIAGQLPQPGGTAAAQREDIRIFSDRGLESRQIGAKGKSGFYAVYQEQAENRAEIQISGQKVSDMHIDTFFTSLLALEKRMIGRDSLIFHCAWLNVGGEGILFSGPSGIGKSTQARLWQQYREAQVMNGDRALLRKVNGQWNACGWPVCGSSEICRLGETPIRAIVMLAKGKENRVKRLSPAKAFSRLYAQITLNQWNRAFVGRGIDLTEELLEEVPVYLLTCNMTEGAVRCLEAALFPEKAQQATH